MAQVAAMAAIGDNEHVIRSSQLVREERLMAKGVIVRYGLIWGLPHHVRVSVGLPEENDRFIEVLRELQRNA